MLPTTLTTKELPSQRTKEIEKKSIQVKDPVYVYTQPHAHYPIKNPKFWILVTP